MILKKTISLLILISCSGCLQEPTSQKKTPFEVNDLDACLVIAIDMSGSFRESWEKDGKAYRLFFEMMEQFFSEQAGSDSEVVLAQISGNEQTIIFHGKPKELRRRFRSPAKFNDFLRENSDPSTSPVLDATRRLFEYVNRIKGVTDKTRMMTIVLSDMKDSEKDKEKWKESGRHMLKSLTGYRELGGTLALYFVHPDEIKLWNLVIDDAGFTPGTYMIENELVDTPQLPKFE